MAYLLRIGNYLRRLAKYIGPGFMIAVGYLDPGNWSVDMEGGSRFGYTLLFVILVSNLIAIFLQNLAIRLGTVSGMDLAAASRHYLPRPLNLFLYVLAELAIIATDVAEVIGSAIALNLLFPSLSLPAGVAITALDVVIILLFYKEDSQESSNYFEWFVMGLVSVVGLCFTIELVLSPVVVSDVLLGFLPSREIFVDKECLFVAIGVIGATVMPHNLFLHSFIVQSRCQHWRTDRPPVTFLDVNQGNSDKQVPTTAADQQHHYQGACSSTNTMDSSSETLFEMEEDPHNNSNSNSNDRILFQQDRNNHDICNDDNDDNDDDDDDDDYDGKRLIEKVEDHDMIHMIPPSHSIHKTTTGTVMGVRTNKTMDQLRQQLAAHVDTNLHYSFMDLVVALMFAFFINAAILIVASANFHTAGTTTVSDLFDAHRLLQQYIGPAAAFVFAIALLCAGQSSTLTATLAGQVVMSGFLGMTARPWLRRLLTRLMAILPAMAAACLAGRSGLSQMLVASQVALSIQLPFAVVPLVYFTSSAHVMKLDIVQSESTLKEKRDVVLSPRKPPSSFWSRCKRLMGYSKEQHQYDQYDQEQPFLMAHRHGQDDHDGDDHDHTMEATCMTDLSSSNTLDHDGNDTIVFTKLPEPLTFANGWFVNVIACLIALLLLGLNTYLVFTTVFN